MGKFTLIKSHKNKEEIHIKLVKAYFDYLNKTTVCNDLGLIVDIFRHSLCVSLDLHSERAYTEDYLQPIYDDCITRLKQELNGKVELMVLPNYKEQLLEVCIHCIILSRDKVK